MEARIEEARKLYPKQEVILRGGLSLAEQTRSAIGGGIVSDTGVQWPEHPL